MSSLRSRPAWIPAAVAAVSMLVVLVLLGFAGHLGSSLNSGGGPASGAVAGALVLLVVGFLGTWRTLRGSAPGSSAVPVFLSTWMVLVIATALAVLIPFVMNHGGLHGLDAGAVSGVRWGWIAALLASLAWRSTQATEAAAAKPEQAPRPRGEAGVVPEGGFVMKRASDFPEIMLDRKAGADTAPEPDAEATTDGDAVPDTEQTPDEHSAPGSVLQPEEPSPPQTAAYSAGHYDDSFAGSDEDPPATRSGGSHRRDPS